MTDRSEDLVLSSSSASLPESSSLRSSTRSDGGNEYRDDGFDEESLIEHASVQPLSNNAAVADQDNEYGDDSFENDVVEDSLAKPVALQSDPDIPYRDGGGSDQQAFALGGLSKEGDQPSGQDNEDDDDELCGYDDDDFEGDDDGQQLRRGSHQDQQSSLAIDQATGGSRQVDIASDVLNSALLAKWCAEKMSELALPKQEPPVAALKPVVGSAESQPRLPVSVVVRLAERLSSLDAFDRETNALRRNINRAQQLSSKAAKGSRAAPRSLLERAKTQRFMYGSTHCSLNDGNDGKLDESNLRESGASTYCSVKIATLRGKLATALVDESCAKWMTLESTTESDNTMESFSIGTLDFLTHMIAAQRQRRSS